MFIDNPLTGYSPVVAFIFLAKRLFLALFLWKFSIGMKTLDALVTRVSLGFGVWVQFHVGFFRPLSKPPVSCYTREMTKQKTPPTQPLTPSKYQKLSTLKDGLFRRLTGVSRSVFALMVEVLTVADAQKKAKGGRKSKRCIEDRLLMALEYLREYRTYFHIAQNYGISESNAYKICKWVEDTLIKDKHFALPGRKALLDSDAEYEVILVDASKSPIERPKKDKNGITLAKRSAIRSKPSSS